MLAGMPDARVAVVHRSDAINELLLAGVERFHQDGPRWLVRQQYGLPQTPEELAEFRAWRPDGILALTSLPPALLRLGVPVVSLDHRQTAHAVVPDEDSVGAAAVEHLAGLGAAAIAHLAIDEENSAWSQARIAGFTAALSRRGLRSHPVPWNLPWSADRVAHLGQQLARLPRPLALFCLNDFFARDVLEAALAMDLRVPADLAILGADDSRFTAAAVPLSSVRVPHGEIGRRSAALLANLLAGGRQAPCLERVPADGVAARQSTDAIGVRDPEVAAVVRFIRDHAGEPFGVPDAVAAANLSRRSLENRFRAVLGRSILEEIHRLRVERAQRLLADPQRSIAAVALDCGFGDAAHFSEVFRRLVGEAPSAWRRHG